MKSKRKGPKLINALNKEKLNKFLNKTKEEDLARLRHQLLDFIYWWIGNPSEERINLLVEKFPFLNEVLDIQIIKSRLNNLDKFEEGYLGVHISNFMPELIEIRQACLKRFDMIPKGVRKAELWLLAYAEEAGADSNLEAAIYFASRGKSKIIDKGELKKSWHKAICQSIVRGVPLATRLTGDVKQRAAEESISLTEAAAILTFCDTLPRFFTYRREEEDFIDASFFRGVEWFDLQGFEPWVSSYAEEIASMVNEGVDHIHTSWFLFFLCRSDLALRIVNKFGLESILWALSNGHIERNKPWKQSSWTSKDYKLIDYTPTASAIIFASERIKPANFKKSVVDAAIESLFQTQMHSGAWPIKSDDPEGSIIATCFAIHALSITKPNGWDAACQLAKNWLLEQQHEVGCWYIDGGPAVMLTILALDSINLATGDMNVTFGLQKKAVMASSLDEEIPDPIYIYSSEPWYDPPYPETTSISKGEALGTLEPKVGLVVATDVELKQVLNKLKPIKGKRKIWKVSFESDTFYLGKFGQFDSVVVMSSMGAEGVTGSALTIETLIKTWKPLAVLLIGIAFGADKGKDLPGNVLIADSIIPYENQRVGDKIVYRSPIPPSSSILLNRFRHALHWKFTRPDKSKVSKKIGPILSGSKLIDDLEFKKQLLEQFPIAIGGEMEGSGLFAAATRNRTEWILVKAVCDWADGKKHKDYQEMAAASAVSLCEFVLSDIHALDGL